MDTGLNGRRRSTVVAAVVAVCVLTASNIAAAPGASAEPDVSGSIVFLDPGHNGDPAGNTRQVPTGRGGTKDCQTSGTATGAGYPEHTFAWDTTLRVRALLSDRGIRSAMSRGDDTSSGPCIDERASAANAIGPAAIVSIHADGGPPAGRGFHVNYSDPPLNAAQSGPALKLAEIMRNGLIADGLTPSDYIGRGGLYGRADLAGLNLAEYPAVLVELGNMRNPAEAAAMQSESGRQRYAEAVTRGIVAYLATTR